MRFFSLATTVALCYFFLSCTSESKQSTEPDQSAEKSIRTAVESLFEAFNRHDLAAVKALYTEDAVMIAPPFEEITTGRENVGKHYAQLFSIPDVRDSVISTDIVGDKAFVEFVSTGTIDMPSGKRTFALNIFTILYFEGGLIYKDVTYYDQEQLNRQLQ